MARKRKGLSAEDQALWSSVAKTTTPMHPKKKQKKTAPFSEKTERPVVKAMPLTEFKIGQSPRTKTQTSVDLSPDVSERVAATPLMMDKKAFRKLSRGRMTPEGRIDLHGMTLAEAHPALIGFILSSHSAGKRLVLVITGKGRSGKDTGGPIPERRGILRDQVPRWLASGPCAGVVMQVAQAHQSHGGGGAYYVYLRRTRK